MSSLFTQNIVVVDMTLLVTCHTQVVGGSACRGLLPEVSRPGLYMVATGEGKAREIQGQGKVREFTGSGKFGILKKVREIQQKKSLESHGNLTFS